MRVEATIAIVVHAGPECQHSGDRSCRISGFGGPFVGFWRNSRAKARVGFVSCKRDRGRGSRNERTSTLVKLAFAIGLTFVLVGPPGLLVVELLRSPHGWTAWSEPGRIGGLLANTLLLAAGACLIAVPGGVLTAIALERVPVPGKAVLRGFVVAGLFLPLPVYAVAWQLVLGTWLPPLNLDPGEVAWRPWAEGLLPAAWVHGVAGFPWVVWIVGAAVRSADRSLEEDALLTGGSGEVVRQVLLPRAMLASAAAAGWVAVTAATEIPVTDAMMVRTFAEEVYTQFVSAADGLAGAVAVTVPVWVATAFAAGWLARPIVRTFGEPAGEPGPPVNLRFAEWVRFAATVGLWGTAIVFVGLPVAAIVWKAGGGGTRVGWELAGLTASVGRVLRTDGSTLAGSIGSATVAGVVAAGLAWAACRFAEESWGFGRFLFVLCVVLWVTPGPLVGLGLKRAIALLLDAEDFVLSVIGVSLDFPPMRSMLYDQPSPIPAGWAAVIRFFPVAVAILWPAIRAVPRELLDAAKLDGVGVWKFVLIPLTGSAAMRAAIAVAALALGEVSAGKLVNPPFRSAYILRLFDQMHYGADSTVAALCLLQIVSTAVIAAGILNIKPQHTSEHPP